MDKIIIANWKMNLSLAEAKSLCSRIMDHHKNFKAKIAVAPPLVYIAYLAELFPELILASQNLSSVSSEFGAFTGEISAKMLRKINVNYAIIGHSERRKNFAEINSEIQEKAKNALEARIVPIICVGEDIEIKNQEKIFEFLESQILACVPKTEKAVILAYEPVWAIGSGFSPSPEDLEKIIHKIANIISKVAKNYQIVYGGSVDGQKARLFSRLKRLDGFLVGGASLNFDEFIEIVKAYA